MTTKQYTDFEYNTTRYFLAYHFTRMWKGRHNPRANVKAAVRDSIRQNITAQRRLKNESHKNYC
jgi:hypothetical protein